MDLLLLATVLQQLVSFSLAGTLPENWRDFIDPDMLHESNNNDLSRYSNDKWEGDISSLQPGERPTNVAANAVDKAELMWPNNTVPYLFTTEQSVRFCLAQRTKITEAMEIIMHLTGQCIKFVERTSETDYIKFQKGYQSFSDVGRTGGKQLVSLSFACAEHYGCIQHELLHLLGFYHEQSRQDRDDHVIINWDNIAKENRVQFAQHAGNTYGLPYDYESIMHYQFNAFAENDQLPTILPKVRRARLGQKENLSPLDVARIHKHFKCTIPSGNSFVVSRREGNKEVKARPASCAPCTCRAIAYCTTPPTTTAHPTTTAAPDKRCGNGGIFANRPDDGFLECYFMNKGETIKQHAGTTTYLGNTLLENFSYICPRASFEVDIAYVFPNITDCNQAVMNIYATKLCHVTAPKHITIPAPSFTVTAYKASTAPATGGYSFTVKCV